MALGQRLKMYCLRRNADVAVERELAVGLVWGGETAPEDVLAIADPKPDRLAGWAGDGKGWAWPQRLIPNRRARPIGGVCTARIQGQAL